MKIAIYSDPLMGKGGGTKVAIDLANALNADIITSGFDEKLRSRLYKNIKLIDIGNHFIKKYYSFGYLFEAPLRFMFCKKYNYDVNIYIGSSSILASSKTRNNIWFSFTPNRIMYDLRDWKFSTASIPQKIVYFLHITFFKPFDQRAVRNNFVEIVAQTKIVQNRIKKYYQKESSIIYSPLDVSKFKFNKLDDYYLAVSRLSPEKRMNLIAETFVELPQEKLFLIGRGQDEKRIKKTIRNSKNITLLTDVPDEKLNQYYANCKAVIYMPIEEDFGLVPLESMASGKICIASNEGGCKETIINRKTGYLISSTKKDLKQIIQGLNNQKLLEMKNDCINRAKEFDITVCIKKWHTLLKKFVDEKSKLS